MNAPVLPPAVVAASGEAPDLEQDFALARSGRMDLSQLMTRADQLVRSGLSEASERLYENWIGATD